MKNKVAPPFREAEFDIIYGEGISRQGDLLDLAAKENIVEKSGSWYSYGELRIGQGREQAIATLTGDPEMFKKLNKEVREKLGLVRAIVAPPPVVEEPEVVGKRK